METFRSPTRFACVLTLCINRDFCDRHLAEARLSDSTSSLTLWRKNSDYSGSVRAERKLGAVVVTGPFHLLLRHMSNESSIYQPNALQFLETKWQKQQKKRKHNTVARAYSSGSQFRRSKWSQQERKHNTGARGLCTCRRALPQR